MDTLVCEDSTSSYSRDRLKLELWAGQRVAHSEESMMKRSRHRAPRPLALVMLTVLFVLVLTPPGHGAPAHSGTVKIVVGVPPGGAADSLARLLVEQVSRTNAVSMMVENRPGGINTIAMEAVARATPDGNTLLLASPSLVLNSQLRRLSYDPFTSFEPICFLVRTPMVVVVNGVSSYRTLADLIRAARTKPGELTLAAAGPGTPAQMTFEMLKRAANVNMTFVPYSGGPPAITALLGGHVTSAISDYSGAAEQLKAGKLRALAAVSRTRFDVLPDVPSIAEVGEDDLWFGLVAPAKTPKETLSQLGDWFTTALDAGDVKAKLAIQGLYPSHMCGDEFSVFLRNRYNEFGRVIRESNVKAE
jgi:tripartite-type tricarboxylate transporter receptor subunit TctC